MLSKKITSKEISSALESSNRFYRFVRDLAKENHNWTDLGKQIDLAVRDIEDLRKEMDVNRNK